MESSKQRGPSVKLTGRTKKGHTQGSADDLERTVVEVSGGERPALQTMHNY